MLKTVAQMTRGESGIIKRMGKLTESDLRKLLSLDLVPETNICLLSHFPSFVIKSDYSELVIDKKLANEIWAEVR